ncbi:MAG: alpha/beta hydrolase [Anaerolineales bacterium]|nr:alpha/beta hydrolase [Anaerolineales bacterium]
MHLRTAFAAAFLFLLAACAVTPATPTATPSPAPTATATFAGGKFGGSDIDVTYCTMEGLPQKLDVYYPKSGGPWPVLIYIHGGSWRELDKAEGEGWHHLNDQGILVVSVNYRLATSDIKFPAMIQDVMCAVRFLRAHRAEYNINPGKIAAIGASAGGHLAALLGTADASAGFDVGEYLDQSSRVQAVVTLSGLSDFTQVVEGGVSMAIYFAFGALAGTNNTLLAPASPVTYITPDDPPFLILHGDKDGVVPIQQALTLEERLTAAGVPSTLVIVYGGDHSLNPLPGKTTEPTWEEISRMIREFLLANLF